MFKRFVTYGSCVLVAAVWSTKVDAQGASVPAATGQASAANFPTDAGSLVGDHLQLLVTVAGFSDALDPGTRYCAPGPSKLRVDNVSADSSLAYVHFTNVPEGVNCPAGMTKVALGREYTIRRDELLATGPRRSGVVFGALVVPFKFRLGDHSLSSSSTIAPYVGFNTDRSFYALNFTPVVSAGLGLVPVKDPAGGPTSTRTAFSAALGLVMGSKKNTGFQAGVLWGRDVLSKADRALEPAASKPWISFYLGYAIE